MNKYRWYCMCTRKSLPPHFGITPGPWTTLGDKGTSMSGGIKCLKCHFWKWRKSNVKAQDISSRKLAARSRKEEVEGQQEESK